MSSWVSRSVSNHNAQLVATAVVSGALVSSVILTYQTIRRKQRVDNLKASIPSLSDEHPATRVVT